MKATDTTINYNEFLFVCLLSNMTEEYQELEYDVLFERIPAMYKRFEESKYNNPNQPLYDSILDYLLSKEPLL